MAKLHAKLPIGKTHFYGFIEALLQAMQFNHVSFPAHCTRRAQGG